MRKWEAQAFHCTYVHINVTAPHSLPAYYRALKQSPRGDRQRSENVLFSPTVYFSQMFTLFRSDTTKKRRGKETRNLEFLHMQRFSAHIFQPSARQVYFYYIIYHTRVFGYCFSCLTQHRYVTRSEFNRRAFRGICSLKKYLFAICRSQAEASDSSRGSISEHSVWSIEKSHAKIDFGDHEDFLDRSAGLLHGRGCRERWQIQHVRGLRQIIRNADARHQAQSVRRTKW